MNLFDFKMKWNESKQKFLDYIKQNNIVLENVYLAFSGGKDSTLLLTWIEEMGLKNKIDVVFFNTGLEYQATIDFVNQKSKEGWQITWTRPRKFPQEVWKEYGVPIISKFTSEMLSRLQKHNFDFKRTYENADTLKLDYPNAKGAIDWLTGNGRITLKAPKYLKKHLFENGLDFKVTNKCCHYLKKLPAKDYEKASGKVLAISGVRQAEGGIRKAKYKGCFTNTSNGTKMYMPLFWMSDNDVTDLVAENQIKLSDCYTKYGLERTGCYGCPFGKEFMFEREVLKKHEPHKSKVIEVMLKDSYLFQEKITKNKQ